MLKIKRQDEIMELLNRKGNVLVTELSELFRCSDETIRRDLKELEDKKLLTRTHGGAFISEKYDKTYPSEIRSALYSEEKLKICMKAMDLIENNDFIFLDSSTTCFKLAKLIINSKKNITIVTNSLVVTDFCSKEKNNVDLIMIGGKLRSNNKSIAGLEGLLQIKSYHADKAFLSPPKFNLSKGIFDNDIFESKIREHMIESSDMSVMLLDHTKFVGSSNYKLSSIDNVDMVITDKPLDKKDKIIMKEHKIKCLIAE